MQILVSDKADLQFERVIVERYILVGYRFNGCCYTIKKKLVLLQENLFRVFKYYKNY